MANQLKIQILESALDIVSRRLKLFNAIHDSDVELLARDAYYAICYFGSKNCNGISASSMSVLSGIVKEKGYKCRILDGGDTCTLLTEIQPWHFRRFCRNAIEELQIRIENEKHSH